MWHQLRILRPMQTSGFRAEEISQFTRYPIVSNQQPMILVYRNQMPVEQPVDGCRQCDAVLDNIRATGRDRLDVSSLNLGPTAAIDHAQAGDRARILIGTANLQPEGRVADLAVQQDLLDPTIDCFGKTRLSAETGCVGQGISSGSMSGLSRLALAGSSGSRKPARTISSKSSLRIWRIDLPCTAWPTTGVEDFAQ
jgi:hypothetical protein